MSDGGKGSKARPFSISHDEYSKRWDAIFGRDLEQERKDEFKELVINKAEYYDILSTEDCLLDDDDGIKGTPV